MTLSTPGTLVLGFIMIDEPANVGVTTFGNGEVLMTFNLRDGGDVNQIMMGLSPNQVLQLIQRLQTYSDICAKAVAEGNGGNSFPEKP